MKPRTIRIAVAALALIGAIVAAPRAVRAQVEVHLTVKPNDDPKAKEAGLAAPLVEATVIGGSPPDMAKLSLTQTDAKPAAISIKASALKKYTEGPETLGIVVLVEGHELWMGNETYVENDADKAVGVFSKLGPALDAISKAGPPGSKGELIIYGKGAAAKFGPADLTQLTGDKLGSQKDFQGTTTRELIAGVNQAYADLQKMSTSRKALIIIGDGTDTAPDTAKPQLADFKKKFEAAHVEVFAIYYPVEGFDGDISVVKAVAPNTKTANSMDNIAAVASADVGELQNRYYIVFPGFDTKLNAGFTWDGKEHAFSLKIDQEDDDAGTLTLVPEWHLPVKSKFPWLWVILGAIVGVILLLVIIAKMGSKKVAAPPPMVVQAPAAPPPPGPPQPASPMKTMMVNLNQDGDGWPVIAWLVPLNGPNQFQTFKLGSNTTIGTGGGAQVVVNDGFMSTEHATIVGTPHGFTLKDRGSTNGCLVNERRVSEHPLIDNDVILMGKTNFKFKTTGE